MLKLTGVKISLLEDIEMVHLIEKAIRGGIAQCSKRYAKANNKYMGNEYDPNKETNYIMYLDGMFESIHFV